MAVVSLENLRTRGKQIKDAVGINSITPDMVGSLAVDTVDTLESTIVANSIKNITVKLNAIQTSDYDYCGMIMKRNVNPIDISMFVYRPNIVVIATHNDGSEIYIDCEKQIVNNQLYIYTHNLGAAMIKTFINIYITGI